MGFTILMVVLGGLLVIFIGFILLVARAHKKVPQGKALIRTGFGGAKVALDSGIFVIPILHKVEEMDISLKTIEVGRAGSEGLICKDNMRADIKVVFFVRVNKDEKYIVEVAQTIGCARASEQETLNSLFDAKFSEALKTVGKGFDFVDLYTEREEFKKGILKTIGTDLNGYILDDCAIDYLEQTSLSDLDQKNILDAQGIRKIEELTSKEQESTNQIRRNREQTIKEQDVETKKNILRLEKQQIEEEQKQKREISELTTEQENSAKQVMINKNLETELIQKQSEQQLGEAEENKQRQIILARLNKEELEKVQQQLVETEEQKAIENREKVVGIARIEKEKILEENKRDIQVIIKERKAEEKKTVEEDQKIEDVKQIAAAERSKKVAEITAYKEAEMQKIIQTRRAEADKLSAEVKAQQIVIEADAKKSASQKDAEARKINAEALAAEEAAIGLAEADVMKAKAEAREAEGTTEANILLKRAEAESSAIQMKAEAERVKGMAEANVTKEKGQVDATITEQKGSAEASVIEQKLNSEAKGIEAKANAMKLLDGVGKDHEEFKLRLDQQKEIKLAEIQAEMGIAASQASIVSAALKQAKIDIVGGETKFFDSIIGAINKGKSIDRLVDNSDNLQALKGAFLGDGDDNLIARVGSFVEHYGISSESVKNLTLSALLSKIYAKAAGDDKDVVMGLIETVSRLGMGGEEAGKLLK
jgi:flotillin